MEIGALTFQGLLLQAEVDESPSPTAGTISVEIIHRICSISGLGTNHDIYLQAPWQTGN
jgi:hypothetical protein